MTTEEQLAIAQDKLHAIWMMIDMALFFGEQVSPEIIRDIIEAD